MLNQDAKVWRKLCLIGFNAHITVYIFVWDVVYLIHSQTHLFNFYFYIIYSFTIIIVFFVLSNIVVSILIDTVWLNFGGLWYEIGIWNTNTAGTATPKLQIQFVFAAQPMCQNRPNSCSNFELDINSIGCCN